MSISNISFPEDKYREIPDLSQHERVTPATDPNFQERGISDENSLSAGMKRCLPGAEEQVTKKQHLSQHQPRSKRDDPKILEGHGDRHGISAWPAMASATDLLGIKEKFGAIAKAKLSIKEAKKRLLVAGREFETLENQCKKPSTTAENSDPHMDNIKETLKKKVSPTTVDQDFDLDNLDFGSFSNTDFDTIFRPPNNLRSAFTDCETQLYEKDNNHVGVEHFPGLAEELQKTDWEKLRAPLNLLLLESKRIVEKLLNLAITLLKFCKILDMETLKKWGATLNNAKELGFQVGFADDLLRKNLYVYFAYRTILDEAKENEVGFEEGVRKRVQLDEFFIDMSRKRKASDFVLILNCHDRIESLEWLVRTDIRDIMKKYQEIKSEHEGEKLTEDEVKRRLLELVEKLKKLEQRSKRYINV
ncbi:hypothetical protein GOBAR_DD09877 [Gossypium barbadense]|nr:hypothetical protein GOBAR_DD09877 [Gossypium barbadense]